jgi:hypothetical protein
VLSSTLKKGVAELLSVIITGLRDYIVSEPKRLIFDMFSLNIYSQNNLTYQKIL